MYLFGINNIYVFIYTFINFFTSTFNLKLVESAEADTTGKDAHPGKKNSQFMVFRDQLDNLKI